MKEWTRNVEKQHNVTLHVGAGTFKPLGEGRIADHEMHGEKCTVSFDAIRALCSGGVHRVATGTTSLRTLESLYWLALKWKQDGIRPAHLDQWAWCNELASIDQELNWDMATAMQWCSVQLDGADWTFQTSIMIVPPYQIRSVQALITNFHLPESTLLMLVSAFTGVEPIRAAYAAAIANRYRFFSYGDAMFLSKRGSH